MVIVRWPITFFFSFTELLLAQRAAAFLFGWVGGGLLALISRSAAEDKNQPAALFSLQPVSAEHGDLWDDRLWWAGMSVERRNVCRDNGAEKASVLLREQKRKKKKSAPWLRLHFWKAIVDGSIRAEETPPTSSLHPHHHPVGCFAFSRYHLLIVPLLCIRVGDLTRLRTPEEPPPIRIHQSCVSPSVCRPVRRCQLACASAKRAVDLSCLSVPERKVATREVRKGHWDRRRLRSEETEGDFSYFSFNLSE